MKKDKQRVRVSYKDMKTKQVHCFAGDFSEPLLRAFSSYCASMLPDRNKTKAFEVYEKASITIEAPDKDGILAILHWISTYAAGDKAIPALGETPLFNGLKVAAAAKSMGLAPDMLSQIDSAVAGIANSDLALNDIKAIVRTYNEGIQHMTNPDPKGWNLAVSNMTCQIFNAQVHGRTDQAQNLIRIISASPNFSNAVKEAVEAKEHNHMKRLAELAAQRNTSRRTGRKVGPQPEGQV